VLFEMLAGRRAFQGDDISTTLAAVLKDNPNWTLLPAETAPHVRTLLRRCGEPPATRPLLATRFNELYGVVSPDGRSIAYLSDESGNPELYVRTIPAMTGQIRVSTNGAFVGSNSVTGISRPAWRPDGGEIIYMAPDGRTVLTVDVRPGQPPDFGAPHPLFTLPSGVVDMMPAPDLGRFLLSLERRSSAPLSVRMLMNWPALLDAAK
jgi:eukaryotic-like serine/threonine-protein kinase